MDDGYSRGKSNERSYGTSPSYGHKAPVFAALSLIHTPYRELQYALYPLAWYVTSNLEGT